MSWKEVGALIGWQLFQYGIIAIKVISYRPSADIRTTIQTEDRLPVLELYELHNVEGHFPRL
jgi:hypothetical protein